MSAVEGESAGVVDVRVMIVVAMVLGVLGVLGVLD